MKKSDLKTGMWIQTKNNNLWLILEHDGEPYAVYPNGWSSIDTFPQISKEYRDFDIVKVWKYNNHQNIPSSFQYETWKKIISTSRLFTQIYPEVETIEIAGQKFNKEEVENALKDLKPIG